MKLQFDANQTFQLDAFVRVEQIDYKKGIKAKLRIHSQTAAGPKEKTVTVKQGADLHALSDERACYANGFEVAEINAEPGSEYLRFANGRTLRLGEEMGSLRDDVWQAQIRHTLKRHLDKELQVRARGIKVLSLFFIDHVANYRDMGPDGKPAPGKFALVFEAVLAELARDERYKELEWLTLPVDKLHNGYFAQDKKGTLRDTRGDTQADDEVCNLIMKEKERLLSMDESLRFIFSHSALREGWDNPNVFQICTLNETRSAMKKREDIRLFVKLPGWFEIDTPVGRYNPDWAILKQNGHALYLVRETKGTKDFLKLRTSEADKVRCGGRHFEAIGVPFDVAVTADEVC